jgi:sugar phosphate isomerase/epimerase
MFEPRYLYCEQSKIAAAIPHIQDLGLGVEVLFESTDDLWPHLRWENLLELVDVLADAEVPVSVHGPFHNLNLGSRDSHIRAFSFEALSAALEFAHAVRSPHLVFHTGFLPQYAPKSRVKWLDAFAANLEPLLQRASDLDVRLAMENTYEPDLTLFEVIFARFPTPALGMCLDTGHALCFGKVNPVEWSYRFADRICHIHCSDNDGIEDLHLGLGSGIVSFQSSLRPLVKTGGLCSLTLEVGVEDAQNSRDYLNDLVSAMISEEMS